MLKKGIMLLIITAILFLNSCQKSVSQADVQELADAFAAIQQKFSEKARTVTTRDEFQALQEEKNRELDELYQKYKEATGNDKMEVIKSRVLLSMGNYTEAEKKLIPLIEKESEASSEAKMVKVLILLSKANVEEALTIFKEIESKITRKDDLFTGYLYFALNGRTPEIRKEYSHKFLNSPEIPEDFIVYKARIYINLAAVAKEQKDMKDAKELLQKALSLTDNTHIKNEIQSELSQIELLGKPAPGISAETWINSRPLSLNNLKGKVVVLDFWATWCVPCRTVIPVLIDEYGKNKEKGLEIIGFTKLYGFYRDDQESKGRVPMAEEKELTKGFIERHQITYPVAISNEGTEFEDYRITGIPTMIFINRAGEIDYIKVGANQPQFIRDKIKKLLEEK